VFIDKKSKKTLLVLKAFSIRHCLAWGYLADFLAFLQSFKGRARSQKTHSG
jgi:hypothetical protein